MESPNITTTPELARTMRRWDLVALVINGVIGAGIFGLPSRIFAIAGDYSVLAFGACALCVAIIVMSFAEVASRFSGTGGPYLYARETFGATTGFMVGWLVWLARVTSFAANSSLLPDYLGFFFPGVSTGLPRAAIIGSVVVLLTALNLIGVRRTADAGNVFAIGKLLPLAVFIGAGLFFLNPARFTLAVAPGYAAFSQSVLLLVYAFTGFEMAVIPAGEIRNPEKTLPSALAIGMAVVVAVYVLIQVVCIGTLPELAGSKRPLADAAAHFMGTGGAVLITGGILFSLAGNLNVLVLAASRILFAMAERDELPSVFRLVHARFRTPIAAVFATSAVMMTLALSGTFVYLLTISTIARLVTYGLTCAALPVLRRKPSAPAAGFQLPAGGLVAAGGIALAIWLLTACKWIELRDASIAILVGLLIYWLHRMRKETATHL